MAIVLTALLGSTLGFLWHNWHPAKIFMGDCGAMFLGFLLAAVSIKTSYQSTTANAIFVPILALGLPIIDRKPKAPACANGRQVGEPCEHYRYYKQTIVASEASIFCGQRTHSP